MNNHLEALALRLREDPFFLAHTLAVYAESEGMDDKQLARMLGCEEDDLTQIRLCRTPDISRFNEEVERIAARFGLNADALAQAVRGGQVIYRLRQSSGGKGTLLAARDDESDQAPNNERDQP